ncbi:hypothetical protein ACFE04_002182 [Oxalis oulophora]
MSLRIIDLFHIVISFTSIVNHHERVLSKSSRKPRPSAKFRTKGGSGSPNLWDGKYGSQGLTFQKTPEERDRTTEERRKYIKMEDTPIENKVNMVEKQMTNLK